MTWYKIWFPNMHIYLFQHQDTSHSQTSQHEASQHEASQHEASQPPSSQPAESEGTATQQPPSSQPVASHVRVGNARKRKERAGIKNNRQEQVGAVNPKKPRQ